MSIAPKQIGWSEKANLLWEISRQLDRTLAFMCTGPCPTTTTTTTAACNCYTISNLATEPTTYSYIDCNGVTQLDLPIAGGESISLCAQINEVNFNDQIIDNGICDGPCAPLLTISFVVNNIEALKTWIGGAVTSPLDWNTFFDLPVNGTPFLSASSNGSDTVTLYNTGTIVLKSSLFSPNEFLTQVIDYGVVTSIGDSCFESNTKLEIIQFDAVTSIGKSGFNSSWLTDISIPNLVTMGDAVFNNNILASNFIFPLLTSLGSAVFSNCFALNNFYAPVLLNLGPTVGDNNVFFNIVSQPITMTIPIALMTCNAGNPDGDIQYLQANNTVTIVTT